MENTIIGIVVGIVIAVLCAIIGKQQGKKQAVVSRKDILQGIVERQNQRQAFAVTKQVAAHRADVERQRVEKMIKEAPNEKIVRMFIDAFDKPTSSRGTRR